MMIVPGACFIPYIAAASGVCTDYHFSFDVGIQEDCQSTAVTNNGVTTGSGYFADAASFNGSSYFNVDTQIEYAYTEEWTLAFWFYIPLGGTLHILHDSSLGKLTGIYMTIPGGSPSNVQFLMSEYDRASQNGDNDIANMAIGSGWHYLHLSNDVTNNELDIWVDGTLTTVARRDLHVYAFGASTRIDPGVEYYLNGYIDDIGIAGRYIDGSVVPTAPFTCCI